MLSDQDRIANMLLSISKIKMLTQAETEENFQNSWKMQDLCCFHLSLIGEDAKLLSEAIKNTHPDIPWHAITSIRNIIVHDYGQVDYHLIWNSVTTGDLIALENALKEMKR